MRYTFKGGIHVDEHKNTAGVRCELLPPPSEVCIPMSQHIGAPAKALVKAGDRVLLGQKIGEVEGLGAPIHSSVSGTVKSVVSDFNTQGRKIEFVIIENDGEDTLSPDIAPYPKKLSECSAEEIIERVREAGISGMGGAAFPTHAKISSAIGKADTVIINCAECEPYITANHRLMLERPRAILNGAKILMKAIGVRHTFIAIEDNKLDAANKMEEEIGDSPFFEVKVMRTKYPQGDERQLTYALTKKRIPKGKLPADVGVVIFNAETAAAVYDAFSTGMPLVKRIVTVDGDCVGRPGNFIVPIGTRYSALAKCAGGLVAEPARIVNGGPMMGVANWDMEAPVTKSTSAVLFLSEKSIPPSIDEPVCIRCGKCVKNCPMGLAPCYLAQHSAAHEFDICEEMDAMSCVECGSCSYNCPAKIEIVQSIRVAKAEIRAKIPKK